MILVTGATGFIGSSLIAKLARDGIEARACVRCDSEICMPGGIQTVRVGDLTGNVDWRETLAGVESVIHAAARVHVMNEASTNPLSEFRRVNVQGTLNLARQAASARVKRFVFISSVKVNGEATQPGRPFTADDRPAPLDAYGISKMEAEQGLLEIAVETGMEIVIIRPPLVYGPGVKANFATMMRWVKRAIPLPFGAIHNQRSLVALDNLVDLILTCLSHPAAANQTFLVSDDEDVSTTELLRRVSKVMHRPVCLIPVPVHWLENAAVLLGKRDMAQRLCGSLQVDIQKTRQLLGWNPPLTLDQGLRQAAERFNS